MSLDSIMASYIDKGLESAKVDNVTRACFTLCLVAANSDVLRVQTS